MPSGANEAAPLKEFLSCATPRSRGTTQPGKAHQRSSSGPFIGWQTYLYRPRPQVPRSATLLLKQALSSIPRIEFEMDAWIWDHPSNDYLLDNHQPGIPPFFTGRA